MGVSSRDRAGALETRRARGRTGPYLRSRALSETIALREESGAVSLKQCERLQFLARRRAEVLQWIDALTGSHQLPEIADGPIGGEVGVDDCVHDSVRARCRFTHTQDTQPVDHGVEIDDLRHLWLVVADRIAIGLGRRDDEVPDQVLP